MTQHYELLFIISSRVPERDHKALVAKVQEHITHAGGTVTALDELGKRKLGYGIKHEQYGAYVLMEFDAESGTVKTLNAPLKLMPEVVRYLIVVKRVRSAHEVEQERKIQEKIGAKRAEARAAAEAQQKEKEAPQPEPKKEETTKKAGKPTAEKISIEDLDKKLDEILKEEL